MEKNYDSSLPKWGPYNKFYTGVSHVADEKEGISFDMNIFPGFYRRSVMVTKSRCDSGAKSWKCSGDGKFFSYRYELEWKDRVYCDAEFYCDDNALRAELKFVNNTDINQSVQADLCFCLRYPSFINSIIREYEVVKNEDILWVNAVSYDEIDTELEIMGDGMKKCERMWHGYTDKTGIDGNIFGKEGDRLTYSVNPQKCRFMGIRYKCPDDMNVKIILNGNEQIIQLKKSREFCFFIFETSCSNISSVEICPLGGKFTFDGFALGDDLSNVDFKPQIKEYAPKIEKNGQKMTLSYEKLNKKYYISWDFPDYRVREFLCSDISAMLIDNIHNHTSYKFEGEGDGHYTDLFLRPVFLKPHSSETIVVNVSDTEGYAPKTESKAFSFDCNEIGKKYIFSNNILAAVTMMNIVYPVRIKEQWIKHHTPGRFWDCLYTWDSGMIGTGLCSVDIKRAEECLNTYLNPVGDKDAPFILHGSNVPTQIFLFWEYLLKNPDIEFVKKYYPSLKQYYSFYGNMRYKPDQPKSGLIKIWKYGYNSGGWDDYPPQQYLHDNGMYDSVTPVITTAITVLFAKLLRMAAKWADFKEDIDRYDDDIRFYSEALSKAWDEESGYFSYMIHDEEGNIKEILRHESGENFNCGLDGIYPFICSEVTDSQKERIKSHIKNDLFTDCGVSAVDIHAPYYLNDGYWNGSVWIPHQWILFKALLDYGERELADEIAFRMLDVWEEEVSETYNCYEHFMTANSRGAGFHQFSGLSSPLLSVYSSYFVKGNITGGFLCCITSAVWNEDKSGVGFEITSSVPKETLIICLNDKYDYMFTADGKNIEAEKLFNGTYSITLEGMDKKIKIEAQKA